MSEQQQKDKKDNSVIDEIPAAPQPQPAGAAPATPPKPQPKPAKPSFFKRIGLWLFNQESKLGRFNRAFVRGLGWFAVCFLVGFLVAFFVLYQPEKSALQSANDNIAELQGQVENVNGQLQSANDEVGRLQDDLAQTQVELSQQTLRAGLTATLNQVNTARVALYDRDGVAAKQALQSATDHLTTVQADLTALDPKAADSILARLALAENELARDPETAKQDLEILSGDLAELAVGLE
ncbi:MAG: hypothetical protein HPY76_10125 [Anaerolineae bacterium]|nr:hypothetical protein [Anaerolineae bacterium]